MCTVPACNAGGTGVTTATGGINYTGGGNVYLYGRTLNNTGTATWGTASGYNLYLGYAAVINNTAKGIWDYTNDYPTMSLTTGDGNSTTLASSRRLPAHRRPLFIHFSQIREPSWANREPCVSAT